MKKIVVWLLSVLFAFAMFPLMGCRSDKNNQNEEGETVEGVHVVDNEVYFGESTEGKTQIKISFVEKGYGRLWLRELSKQFVRDNPEYYIYMDGDPNLTESIATKLEASRNLSDIYCPVGSMWEPYVYKGYIEQITDVYNSKPDGEEGKTVLEKLIGSWKTYGYVENDYLSDYYVMPWNETITGIVYNAKMFRQYNWEVPTTTDELYALCEQILSDTNGKVKPFVYGGAIGGYFDYLGGTWWMQEVGAEGMEEFYGFSSVDVFNPNQPLSAARQHALEEFSRFFTGDARKFSISDSMSKNHITSQTDFLRGNAAMIPNASWMEREMKSILPDEFEIKMMSVPYSKYARKDSDGNFIQCNYATAPDYMFIPRGASCMEGAKKFLTYISSDKMLRLYTKYAASPRPMRYDVDTEGMSPFSASVIDLWRNSEKYFISSKHPAYTKSIIRPNGIEYIDPYSSMVFDTEGRVTGRTIIYNIWDYAKKNWDTWLSDADM